MRLRWTVCVPAFLLLTSVVYASAFPDVPDSHPHREAIERLVGAGVVKGNDDGTFAPHRTVNRAEMLMMLYRAKGKTPDPINRLCYKDVEPGGWYESVVCDATANGYVEGYSDGTFRPSDPVERVEALKMITTVLEIEVSEISDKERDIVKFVDVSVQAWYTKYLYAAFTKGILPIPGQDGARFYPDWPLMRSEAAAYVLNAIEAHLYEERQDTGDDDEEEVEETNVFYVDFPFEANGKFNGKSTISYRFVLSEPKMSMFTVSLQSGQPGSVTCRLYLLDNNGFSDEYYLGYREGDKCYIKAHLSSGSYQYQIQPSEPDTTYYIIAEGALDTDANDGFGEARTITTDLVRAEVLTAGDFHDWFTFTLENENKMTVDVSNAQQLSCVVYAMSDVDLYGFSGPECNRRYMYPPGTYYVVVGRLSPKGAQQTYTIRLAE